MQRYPDHLNRTPERADEPEGLSAYASRSAHESLANAARLYHNEMSPADRAEAARVPQPRIAREEQGSFRLERKGERPGVYYKVEYEEKGSTEIKIAWEWVCSLFEPLAKTRDQGNRNWGRLLEITDGDGVRHIWSMPAKIGPTVGDGIEFRRELADRGLEIASGGKARNRLNDYVTTWKPTRRVRCVGTVGWCGDAFVMPDQTYGGDEEITLQLEGAAPEFVTTGYLERWRRDIADLCVGNNRLIFAVSAAAAGPLQRIVGEESGGIHFRGGSSIGKTTMLHVGRSFWGAPLGSWRTTDNSAEAIAAGACDTLLTLDEISQASPAVVRELAYMLGNGRGKGRMRRNATLRPTHRWRLLFLSTGEVGMATRIAEGGSKTRAGQEVRVLEIPADAGKGWGVFEDLHGFSSPAELAEHLRLAADRDCGRAARTFLAHLTLRVEEVAGLAIEARDAFISETLPEGADGQVRRACGRFALIAFAGELATEFGITGWSAGAAKAAAVRCFEDWLAARGGTVAAEVREAFAQVRSFIEQHGESRFSLAWDQENERPVSNRAGFRKAEPDGPAYYILPEVWRREVCKGFDPKTVTDAMIERGWLIRGPDRLTRKERIPGEGTLWVYLVSPAFLCGDIQK